MLIRDIRSNQQLENAKKLQAEYLQLMIDNEKLLEERVNNYRNPNKPPPVPPQYKSASEIQLDSMRQERDAIDNLLSLGLDYPTSSSIAQSLQQRQDGVANLLKLNKNFPFIKKDITERFNPKLLDSRVLLTYLDEVFRELDETMGLKTTSQKSTDFFQRDATGVKGVLPSKELIDELINVVDLNVQNSDLDDKSINELNTRLELLQQYLPDMNQIDMIDTYPPLEKNRIFKDIERLIKTYHIPTLNFINERINKLGVIDNNKYKNEQKEVDEMNQGIFLPGGGGGGGEELPPPPPPEKRELPQEIITQLSILLNSLGMIDSRGIEKLKEFKSVLIASDYNIKRKATSIEGDAKVIEKIGIPIPTLQQYEADVIEQEEIASEVKKNKRGRIGNKEKFKEDELMKKINELTEEEIFERFSNYGKKYIGTELGKYKYKSPYYVEGKKVRPIFEYLEENKKQVLANPFFRFNKAIYELNDADNYDNYLFYNIAVVNKDDEVIKEVIGGVDNPDTYRYSIEQLRQIILINELPLILDKPNTNKVNQVVPTQGFGLTNKIIKHFKEDNRDLEDLNKSFKRHMKVEKKVDDSESDSDSEKKKGKGVLKKFTHTRIKIGKGIELEEEPKFKTFGKYIIHMRHLADNNVLNVKFPSGGTIPSIKPVQIDDNFKDFIYDVLNSGKMNERHFNNLTKSEQNHFVKIAKGAKLINKLGIKTNDDLTSEAEVNRFELLKGEYDAGNNNGNLVKELRGLVIKFMKGGRINKKQGMDFLLELSIV